jgi:hypothetical protein
MIEDGDLKVKSLTFDRDKQIIHKKFIYHLTLGYSLLFIAAVLQFW